MGDLQIVAAGSLKTSVEAQYVEMKVPLYSYGCQRKLKKSLSHLKGIYSVKVDFVEQKVTVWGICNKYDVLDTIKNKRKDAKFWNPEDNITFKPEAEAEADGEEEETSGELAFATNPKVSSKLIKSKSFSLRALRKVFSRSLSFSGSRTPSNRPTYYTYMV